MTMKPFGPRNHAVANVYAALLFLEAVAFAFQGKDAVAVAFGLMGSVFGVIAVLSAD